MDTLYLFASCLGMWSYFGFILTSFLSAPFVVNHTLDLVPLLLVVHPSISTSTKILQFIYKPCHSTLLQCTLWSVPPSWSPYYYCSYFIPPPTDGALILFRGHILRMIGAGSRVMVVGASKWWLVICAVLQQHKELLVLSMMRRQL